MTLLSQVVARAVTVIGAGNVYADGAPDDAPLPYIVVRPDVSTEPALTGDGGRALAWRRGVTIEIHETLAANPEGLPAQIRAAFDGWRPAGHTAGRVSSSREQDGTFDHTLTVVSWSTVERP